MNDLRTSDISTIKADLFLAGCTQLIGVILAKSLCKPELYKSVRKLVKSAC